MDGGIDDGQAVKLRLREKPPIGRLGLSLALERIRTRPHTDLLKRGRAPRASKSSEVAVVTSRMHNSDQGSQSGVGMVAGNIEGRSEASQRQPCPCSSYPTTV